MCRFMESWWSLWVGVLIWILRLCVLVLLLEFLWATPIEATKRHSPLVVENIDEGDAAFNYQKN